MSPLQNQNPISTDLTSPEDQPSIIRRSGTAFDAYAALITDENRFEYQSALELVRVVEEIINSDSAEEYFLYFHGIVYSELEVLDGTLHSHTLRSTVRFTFENASNALILHVMPGPEHETVSFNLAVEIIVKIASIPGHSHKSVTGMGATRFQGLNIDSREGDQCLRPDTRAGSQEWPSVMIEVGYSLSLIALRLSAEWWLIHSGGDTRFVIIVKITRNPFMLHIECWKMIATGRRQTRHTSALAPSCVQAFDINAAGFVVSASPELRIPYQCIFDLPHANAADVVFTFAELSSFALSMFQQLQ